MLHFGLKLGSNVSEKEDTKTDGAVVAGNVTNVGAYELGFEVSGI